jgi:hypothetical protein
MTDFLRRNFPRQTPASIVLSSVITGIHYKHTSGVFLRLLHPMKSFILSPWRGQASAQFPPQSYGPLRATPVDIAFVDATNASVAALLQYASPLVSPLSVKCHFSLFFPTYRYVVLLWEVHKSLGKTTLSYLFARGNGGSISRATTTNRR